MGQQLSGPVAAKPEEPAQKDSNTFTDLTKQCETEENEQGSEIAVKQPPEENLGFFGGYVKRATDYMEMLKEERAMLVSRAVLSGGDPDGKPPGTDGNEVTEVDNKEIIEVQKSDPGDLIHGRSGRWDGGSGRWDGGGDGRRDGAMDRGGIRVQEKKGNKSNRQTVEHQSGTRSMIIDNLVPNKTSGITSLTLEWKSSPTIIQRPCGMAFMNDGTELIVADNDSKGAKVLNVENGELCQTIANQHTVFDVCMSGDNKTVLFSNNKDERVEEYRVSTRQQVFHYKSWMKRKQTPRGVAFNQQLKQYAVVNRQEPAVYTYPSVQNSTEQLTTPRTFGADILQSPTFICTDKLNKYYVSDEMLHQVIVFNSRGQVIGKLGQKGSKPGELLKPQGVAVDDWGNVIVADCMNDRLSMFSADGRFLRHVQGTSTLLRPVGLVIHNNMIAVSQQYMNWNNVALYTVDL